MTARTQRFFNPGTDPVAEMLEGFVLAHPGVVDLDDGLVVRAEPKPDGRVGLVIGNGSGHEPAMIGWIGEGLLDVNVPGPVFSSPGPARIVAGIRAADRGAGVLLLVSNHSGDVMNASTAIEDAMEAGMSGVEMVTLYDDIASAPPERRSDRRGGAGLFFVWKTVGAAAEAGASLAECVRIAELSRDRTRSIAAAVGSVAHPISGQVIGDNDPGSVIVGLGVHGEAGTSFADGASADEITDHMVNLLVADAELDPGAEVAVLVNNAGSLTVMEMSILYRGVVRALNDRGVDPVHGWTGTYATTQDLAGFTVAICTLDEELRELYEAPATAAAFAVGGVGS